MAVSGSFDFTLNRDALITRALRIIGASGAGETPTADEISDASLTLNLVLKAWQSDGLQLFAINQVEVTPIQGQATYTMGTGADINVPRPEDVIEVYRRLTASEYDTPLHRRARVDFNGLPNKSNEGVPTQYYFDAKLALPELEIWPTASATFASDYTLQVLYQRPFDDMDATADTLAFPQTWELAVVLGLASQLAVEYGLGLNDRRDIRQMADIEKRRVMDWDTEKAGIFLAPDYRNNGSGWGYY